MTNRFSNQLGANEAKESLLRTWYNLDVAHDFDAGAAEDPEPEILCETGSEEEEAPGGLLLETSSDSDAPLREHQDGSDDVGQVLIETDSECASDEPEQPVAKKRRYSKRSTSQTHKLEFLSMPVCRYAHTRLYAIGSGVLQKMRSGERGFTMHEGRLGEPKHQTTGVSLVRRSTGMKWPNIIAFFWHLWISCAEILPVRFTLPESGSCKSGLSESYVSQDIDFQERYVRNFLACIERNYDRNPAIWT